MQKRGGIYIYTHDYERRGKGMLMYVMEYMRISILSLLVNVIVDANV